MIKRVDSGGQVHLVTNIRKPRKWRRYEYLESSGTLYIDTGVNGYMNHRYELDYQLIGTGSYRMWGVFGQSAWLGYNMSITYAAGRCVRWSSTSNGLNLVDNIDSINDITRHTIIINKGLIYYDGADKGKSNGHLNSCVISYPIYLFTVNPANTAPTANAVARVYSYKDYDASGNLVRHMVPAQYNGEYGMWDLVEDRFYPNKGTGTFTVGPEIKNYDEIYEVRKTTSLLPSGVELYDYILNTTGSEFIDTGFIPDNTSGIKAEFYCFNVRGSQMLVGRGRSSDNTRWWINPTSNNAVSLGWNTAYSGLLYSVNTWTTIEHNYKNNRTAILNESTNLNANYPNLSTTNESTYIFKYNNNGSAAGNFMGRIKYVLFTRGSLIVHKFLPCTYLGEPGMWDTVENKFYRNQGTGQFTLGNKITLKEYEYLQGDGSSTYIDTNYYPNVNTKLILKRSNPATGGMSDGEIDGNLWQNGAFYISASLYAFDLYQSIDDIRNTSPYIVVLDKGILIIDNNIIHLYSGYRNDWVSPRKFYLLGNNKGDGNIYYNANKIYYCLLYENNQLVRDFIPVSYNGTPGLWDKVEWKFYADAGSGAFILGPEKKSGIYHV